MKKWLDRIAASFGKRPGDSKQTSVHAPVSMDLTASPRLFTPQNELERLLVLAAGDPSKRMRFQQALLESDLYVATAEAPERRQSRTLQTDEKMQIRVVSGADGKPIPAILTSEARVGEIFGYGVGFVRMKAEDVLNIVVNDGAVLNPGLSYGVHWSAEDLAAILGRPVQHTIEKETQLLLGTPSELPNELIETLRTSFNREPEISEAWLALAIWPENEKRSWYVDIRSTMATDDMNKIVWNMLKGVELHGHPVDIIVNPSHQPEGVGIRIKPAQTH